MKSNITKAAITANTTTLQVAGWVVIDKSRTVLAAMPTKGAAQAAMLDDASLRKGTAAFPATPTLLASVVDAMGTDYPVKARIVTRGGIDIAD